MRTVRLDSNDQRDDPDAMTGSATSSIRCRKTPSPPPRMEHNDVKTFHTPGHTPRNTAGRTKLAAALVAAVALGGSGIAASASAAAEPPVFDLEPVAGELVGSGATFPGVFYAEAIAELEGINGDLVIEYGGGGSSKGRSDLQQSLVDFAGTDGVVKAEDYEKFAGEFVYIPTVLAPIVVAYNLDGVDTLNLTPTVIAQIFQTEITSWDDPAIVELNSDVTLPAEPIVVVRRADGSGTTDNFSKFLNAAVGGEGGVWTLGSGSELEWPAGTQAGDGSGGVSQLIKDTPGAIGYLDLADATVSGLSGASVENKEGVFVAPTIEATTAAAAGAEIADDLTFFVGWADGADAYPIAAQTWILAYVEQPDAEQAAALRYFLTYLLTDGQALAVELNYAPLPAELRDAALANVALIGA